MVQFNEETSAQGAGPERDGPARVRRMPVSEVAALLRQDALAVARALLPGGRQEGRHWVAASTRRGGPGDSLKVNITPPHVGRWRHFASGEKGDLLDLARREFGDAAGEEWARRRVGDRGAERTPAVRNAPPVPDTLAEEADKARRRALACVLWDEARPIADTQAAAYLAARLPGVDVLRLLRPDVLRFLPRHDGLKRRFPIMVARVTEGPDGGPLAVHRTYLHPDPDVPQKAPVTLAKMGLGSPGGGGIWLTDAGPRMVAGEGIETTLSGLAALAGEGWGAVVARDASGLKNLTLPPEVREVCILVNVDKPDPQGRRPGEAFARQAAARWAAEGRKVSLAFPGAPDGPPRDFNDLWREGGAAAVRAAIDAAEIVPNPAIATDAEHQSRIMAHVHSLICDGPPVPPRVFIIDEATPLPDVLPLEVARRRVSDVVGSWVGAASRAWANDRRTVKDQAGRLARQELLALPEGDPRRHPGKEQRGFLGHRRWHHRADLRQRLDAAGWSAPARVPGTMVLKATLGLGKTEAAIAAVAQVRRDAPVPLGLVWLARTHELAKETMARFAAKGVPAVVLGGRGQYGPDGAALCDRAAMAARVGAAGLNVRRTLCQGAGEECPFFRTCGYYRQVENIPLGAVVIATHDSLTTGRLPGGALLPGLVIVDESPTTALVKQSKTQGRMADLRRLAGEAGDVWPQVAAVVREVDGLLHLPDLAGAEWREWLTARGVAVAELQAAIATLHAAIPSTVGSPGNDDAVTLGLHRAEAGIRDKRKMAALFEALARDWVNPGRNVQSVAVGWRKITRTDDTGNTAGVEDKERCWFACQPPAPIPDGVSSLVLDATADDEVTQAVLGPHVRTERIAALQHLAVTQVTKPSFSLRGLGLVKGQPEPERKVGVRRQGTALEIVRALVKRHGPGKVAVITYKALRALWETEAEEHGFVLGHFGAVLGLDAMGECTALVVVGRVLPLRNDVEAMARMIYADDPVPLVGLLAPSAKPEDTNHARRVGRC